MSRVIYFIKKTASCFGASLFNTLTVKCLGKKIKFTREMKTARAGVPEVRYQVVKFLVYKEKLVRRNAPRER